MKLLSRSIALTLFGLTVLTGGCHPASGPAAKTDAQELPSSDQATIAGRVDQMQLVAQGVGKQLSYKVPHLGQLIIYDQDSGQFIYHGTVAKGEMFVFEPASSWAQINKQTINLDHVTNGRDEYRLYFVPQ